MSLRRLFDITFDYVDNEQERLRSDAMERIVQSAPRLNARYLEKMSRIQELLVDGVRTRLAGAAMTPDPADPRPAAIVGAAFACLIAARAAWLVPDQTRPFSDLLEDAMAALENPWLTYRARSGLRD